MMAGPLPIVFLTLAGAIALDALFGDPPTRFHPVGLMGRYINFLWRKKPSAGRAGMFLYGIWIILSGLVVFVTPVLLIVAFDLPFYWLWTIPILKATFAVRSLFHAASEIRVSLERNDLPEARRLLAYHLVSRPTGDLTEAEVVSATVESLAENITDSFTSPVFYFLIFGLPGAVSFRFINTADAMIAYRDTEHEFGGKFTAWCDMTLNWIPARLTGLLLVAAAALGRADWRGALKTMASEHGRTASPNAGWTMAAMAGALNVTLKKREHYSLSGGTAVCAVRHISVSRRILLWSVILITIVLTGIRGVIYAVR